MSIGMAGIPNGDRVRTRIVKFRERNRLRGVLRSLMRFEGSMEGFGIQCYRLVDDQGIDELV